MLSFINVNKGKHHVEDDALESETKRIKLSLENAVVLDEKGGTLNLNENTDKIAVVGFYGEEDDEEARKYVEYGCDRVTKRYNQQAPLIFSSIVHFGRYKNLSALTQNSMLVLIGHGGLNEYDNPTFAGLEADHLAEVIFEDCELKLTDSITFISCNIGATSFMYEFKSNIGKYQQVPNPAPVLYAFSRPIKMGFDGTLWVDHGEEIGFESAEKYKVTL